MEENLLELTRKFETFSRESARLGHVDRNTVRKIRMISSDLNELLESKEYGAGSPDYSLTRKSLLEASTRLRGALNQVEKNQNYIVLAKKYLDQIDRLLK